MVNFNLLQKKDIFSALIIGEVCALLVVFLTLILQFPEIVEKIAVFFPIILPPLSFTGVFFVAVLGQKRPVIFQMGKTFLVGILNTLIDLSVLNVLMRATMRASGWPYALFKGFSFSAAIVNSYFWNKSWSFKKQGKAEIKEFGKFYGVTIIGLIIHIVSSSVVVNVIGPQFGLGGQEWGTIGGIVAAFSAFLWDFLSYKLLVFKK